MVCRLFCELATPLMFPILHVGLSQSSLDLAEKMARHPAMAAGVRGIKISLAYGPAYYAESLVRHRDLRLQVIRAQDRSCWYNYEVYTWTDEVDTGDEEEKELLERACGSCDWIIREWEAYVKAVEGGEVPERPLTKPQQDLCDGYAEFCRLQQDQSRLLRDGTFANALASTAARIPNACAVKFVGSRGPSREFDTKSLVLDDTLMARFMPSALTWEQIVDETKNGALPASGLEYAKLLWEVPIALHRAGVALAELSTDVIPVCHQHFSMLQPKDHTNAPAYDELSAACERLVLLEVSVFSCIRIRYDYLPEEDGLYIDNFLGAILARCGPNLQILEIKLADLSIQSGRGGSIPEGSYHADPFLSRLQGHLPKLRYLVLIDIELQHKTLAAFCNSLSPELERVCMYDVTLHNGPWADILDVLREKLSATTARRRGSRGMSLGWWVLLTDLLGGEFGHVDVPDVPPAERWRLGRADRVTNPLVAEAEKFVAGLLERNPLRGEEASG